MTIANHPSPATTETYTAFRGQRLLASGALADIARYASGEQAEEVLGRLPGGYNFL